LVVADYSQIELRIAAIIANDAVMLEAYQRGADLHKKTAAAIAGIAEVDVTKGQRQLAKACNFGLIYGMGAKTLAAYASAGYGVPMTLSEADKARSKFFAAYPGIHRWQAVTKARGISDSTVKTAGGLIRDLSKEPGGWQLTKALNTPVQGTGAEILLAALAQLPKAMAGLDAQLIHHVHDEIVLEVAEADSDRAKIGLVQAMDSRHCFPMSQCPVWSRPTVAPTGIAPRDNCHESDHSMPKMRDEVRAGSALEKGLSGLLLCCERREGIPQLRSVERASFLLESQGRRRW
jgi:DNA polymerase I-like protein with 3'-5' exonuclease and polymerase domains